MTLKELGVLVLLFGLIAAGVWIIGLAHGQGVRL